MASNQIQTVVYDDFSKGDWGLVKGDKGSPGSFGGRNVLVRADGFIGPRPGWKAITPASMPVGRLLCLENGPTPGRDGMFIIGNTVYSFDLFNPAASPSVMGHLDTTPSVILKPFLAATKWYVSVPGDKTYVIDPVAFSVAGLTGSPGGHVVVQYGARLVVAESTSSNRLFVSDPSDFNSWPAGNFIDIGDSWQITGMYVQKNHLVITKREGIYVLTGVPGSGTEVVRLIDTMRGPLHPWHGHADADDILNFVRTFGQAPAAFDGSDGQEVSYLKYLTGPRDDTDALPPTQVGVTVMDGELTQSTVVMVNKAAAPSADVFLVKQNNIWTYHETGLSISGLLCSDNGVLVSTDGGTDSTAAWIVCNRFNLGRPGFQSDGFNNPANDLIDGFTGVPIAEIFLPMWNAPDGHDVTVRSVRVDFKKYQTGATEDNYFDIDVYTYGGFKTPGDSNITWGDSWTEANSVADTNGVYDSHTALFPRALGTQLQIRLKYLKGVDIKSVTMEVELFPKRTRA